MFFYNPTYLLFMAPAFILMMLTSWYVKSAYNKWSKVQSGSRMTGLQAAQRLVSTSGLYGVKIEGIAGNLSDHYDPRSREGRCTDRIGEGIGPLLVQRRDPQRRHRHCSRGDQRRVAPR